MEGRFYRGLHEFAVTSLTALITGWSRRGRKIPRTVTQDSGRATQDSGARLRRILAQGYRAGRLAVGFAIGGLQALPPRSPGTYSAASFLSFRRHVTRSYASPVPHKAGQLGHSFR